MLMTFARKAITIPIPTNSNGVAFRIVAINASPDPNAPRNISEYPSIGSAPRRMSMMAPNRRAAKTARTGML